MLRNRQDEAKHLRIEELVALLAALETLDPLLVHLLSHLVIASLFFLCSTAVLDALDVGLRSECGVSSITFPRKWGRGWDKRERRVGRITKSNRKGI